MRGYEGPGTTQVVLRTLIEVSPVIVGDVTKATILIH